MPWWKRFRSTKATLPAATTASAVCAIALAAIWFTGGSEQPEVERFGSTMANTLAKTTAGDLLDNQRINLAVIANHVSSIDEVDGVTFFDNANNVIAMSGSQNGTRRFTATANIDDTITGYVSLHLNTQAFQPPKPWIRWLASLATVLADALADGVVNATERARQPFAAHCVSTTRGLRGHTKLLSDD